MVLEKALERAAQLKDCAGVSSLVYSWDMSLIFFTLSAIRTLHDDARPMRERCCRRWGKLFPKLTVGQLETERVQIVMPFPCKNVEANLHVPPLTCPVPLKQSRYVEFGSSSSTNASVGVYQRAMQRLDVALDMGQMPEADDAKVDDMQRADAGTKNTRGVEGNLFAWSTWVKFTTEALRARGMLTEAEEHRVDDQGIFLQTRMANALAASDDPAVRALAPEHIRDLKVSQMQCATQDAFDRQNLDMLTKFDSVGHRLANASARTSAPTKRRLTAEELQTQRLAKAKEARLNGKCGGFYGWS